MKRFFLILAALTFCFALTASAENKAEEIPTPEASPAAVSTEEIIELDFLLGEPVWAEEKVEAEGTQTNCPFVCRGAYETCAEFTCGGNLPCMDCLYAYTYCFNNCRNGVLPVCFNFGNGEECFC
ncbi:MAG: hypothetical protein AAF725_08345 [Acidobacteriota bacterium]